MAFLENGLIQFTLKLMVFDVNTTQIDQIPLLQGSKSSFPSDSDCGIHAIEINPSRTLLATGAKNVSDIAVYRLPTLDPIFVGEVSRDLVPADLHLPLYLLC